MPKPRHLYLRNNKLWFVRDKYFTPPARCPGQPRYPTPSPTAHYVYISYFDLKDERSVDITVDFIKEVGETVWNSILLQEHFGELKWVQDSMIIQLARSKFARFNLTEFEWSTLESSVDLITREFDNRDGPDELVTFSGPDTKCRLQCVTSTYKLL